MSKISKNIKRLRTERGFTQDSLAEKINITRQAVSSWENDRTQPDVEMLVRLAEVLEVSFEELIYGKKRNTTLELEKQSYNNTITIVFSILGALLVGAGLVLIFVTFWKDMPLLFKGLLSFVPLILGQASGLFVLWKKKDKAPWCEGGSVLWTAGIAATLTLIYNIFDLSIDWTSVLLLITLSVMPVILLLRVMQSMELMQDTGVSITVVRSMPIWGSRTTGSSTIIIASCQRELWPPGIIWIRTLPIIWEICIIIRYRWIFNSFRKLRTSASNRLKQASPCFPSILHIRIMALILRIRHSFPGNMFLRAI